MKIVNFGSLNIDHVYNVAHFPLPGETVSSTCFKKYCGGKGLNQSVAVRNSGVEIYHAGQVGPDGEMLLQYLRECGVDISHICCSEQPTGHALIQVDEAGQNSIILFEGANKTITHEFMDTILGQLSAGDILLLQNEINDLPYLLKRAREKEVVVFFNPAPFTREVKDYPLEAVDYLVVNETEAMGLTETEGVDAAIAWMSVNSPCRHTVVTLGTDGCCYLSGGVIRHYGNYRVKPVDSTAAGDTFIGYLVGGIACGNKIEDALILASKAAALAVTKPGASVSIPTMSQVLEAKLEYVKSTKEKEQTT